MYLSICYSSFESCVDEQYKHSESILDAFIFRKKKTVFHRFFFNEHSKTCIKSPSSKCEPCSVSSSLVIGSMGYPVKSDLKKKIENCCVMSCFI